MLVAFIRPIASSNGDSTVRLRYPNRKNNPGTVPDCGNQRT